MRLIFKFKILFIVLFRLLYFVSIAILNFAILFLFVQLAKRGFFECNLIEILSLISSLLLDIIAIKVSIYIYKKDNEFSNCGTVYFDILKIKDVFLTDAIDNTIALNFSAIFTDNNPSISVKQEFHIKHIEISACFDEDLFCYLKNNLNDEKISVQCETLNLASVIKVISENNIQPKVLHANSHDFSCMCSFQYVINKNEASTFGDILLARNDILKSDSYMLIVDMVYSIDTINDTSKDSLFFKKFINDGIENKKMKLYFLRDEDTRYSEIKYIAT